MDIYEARRLVVRRLIKDRFGGSQAEFAKASGLSASYVTRMLKEDGEPSKKRIGEDIAQKLEGMPALGIPAGALVNPLIRGRAEHSDTDLTIHGGADGSFVIELKDVHLGEHTLTVDELQDLVYAAIDLPLPKARELIAQVMIDAETARQAAMQYLARHGARTVVSNERAAEFLPSAAGLPPPVQPRKSQGNVSELPAQGIASKGPRLSRSTTLAGLASPHVPLRESGASKPKRRKGA